MDIMAVQAEVPREIDADQEIFAVGLSNVAAGLFTGGGPGVFPSDSQTVHCINTFRNVLE
jgi:MFS superfamily sulfate permease-like transporter